MRIFTVCTNKGGVGKTTTSISLLDYLAGQGVKCLGVDLDPQGNLTKTVGIINPKETARDLFVNKNSFPIHKAQPERGFDIIPANKHLAEVEQKIFSRYNSHTILGQKLRALSDKYDYCVIDCSSHIDIMTQNALACADVVLCPIAPEGWSFDGFENIKNEIQAIKESGLNTSVHIGAVILHKYHRNYVLHKEIFAEFKDLEYPVFTVSENVAVSEAQYNGISLFEYQPSCHASKQMQKIFNTLLQDNGKEIQKTK